MKAAHRWVELAAVPPPLFLAIGYFDGVHRGHAAVVGAAVARARERGGRAWALTFDPHPARVLRPESAPPAIETAATRVRRLRALGVDGCALTPFTPEFAALEPEEFVAALRRDAPGLAGVAVGPNWRFGRGARGDAARLREIGRASGFDVEIVPAVLYGGAPISSTRIRRAVERGDLAEAAEMLGRPFAVEGTVEAGRQVGRTLGYPTANIRPSNELMPPAGIYAARLRLADGRALPAAAYRGGRPTFGPGGAPALEVHALDTTLDLYGQPVEVEFVRRIRDDRRFDDPAALRAQIAEDLRAIRAAL